MNADEKKHAQDAELRHSHPFRMWDAIMETPSVIKRCLDQERAEPAVCAGRELGRRGFNRIFLLGCGTSNYAAISASYALAELAGMDADAYDAFEFSRYRLGLVKLGSAAAMFSHSGATRVTVDAAKLVRHHGAFTIALTDMPESMLVDQVDALVPVGGGKEPVEPKTRSYINTVVMAYQMAAAVRDDASSKGAFEELALIPDRLAECQSLESQAKELAHKYSKVKRVFVVGGGPNFATALEIALKFKEAVLLAGEGFEAEEAFHGPIASLSGDTLVIGISTPGPSYDKIGYFLKAATIIGSPAISVTSQPYGLQGVDTMKVPLSGIRETFSNAVLVYPLYMLAYYSALARGNNPDSFRVGDEAFHEAMEAVPSVTYEQ